jgi:hypothetical protein
MTDPPSVVVEPGNPLEITDSYRTFGTVEVKPGGAIIVSTTEDVSIETLKTD